MTIEIHEPELEELIRRRMEGGKFVSVEEALIQALKCSPIETQVGRYGPRRTGAELVAAMQRSPYREIDLAPRRPHLPVRDVAL